MNLLKVSRLLIVITINVNRLKIRNTVIPLFHHFLYNKSKSNTIDNDIVRLYKEICTFRKKNPNIVFRADEGNITVALNKDMYIKRMEEFLNDKNTYH